jgi:hypothetical protein
MSFAMRSLARKPSRGTCEAAFVRTGHHGRRIDGLEVGRFEDAHNIPVAIFPQHTSRNGDPQLHVHILWLNFGKAP